MRTLVRKSSTLLAVAALPLVVSLAPTPAAAAPAPSLLAAPAAINPNAVVTSAEVTFTTNDEDKDADTKVLVAVGVDGDPGYTATASAYYGHFNDNSVNGPFPLQVLLPTTATALTHGLVTAHIITNPLHGLGHDTWRFNLEVTVHFSDGNSYVIRRGGLELSVGWLSDHTTEYIPFSVVTQVPVPGVVGLSSGSAALAIQRAGLTVGGVSHQVDPTCGYIRTVMRQFPDPGTVVDPGTPVSYVIGDKPSTPCF
jgi:hypothetical protein